MAGNHKSIIVCPKTPARSNGAKLLSARLAVPFRLTSDSSLLLSSFTFLPPPLRLTALVNLHGRGIILESGCQCQQELAHAGSASAHCPVAPTCGRLYRPSSVAALRRVDGFGIRGLGLQPAFHRRAAQLHRWPHRRARQQGRTKKEQARGLSPPPHPRFSHHRHRGQCGEPTGPATPVSPL